MVENRYSGKGFQTSYRNRAHLDNLENIFRMLAGQGPREGHTSELVAAIEREESGTGKTEFFEFKAFKNGNLHLVFLNEKLLTEFNRIAGGAVLAHSSKAAS